MGPEMPPDMGMTPADEIRFAPEPREASFVRLAEAYRKEGLLRDAVRICRDGLARFPASWPGRIVLGRILLEQGAIEEAYDELERFGAKREASPRILAPRGRCAEEGAGGREREDGAGRRAVVA